jgi:hypothetical protein
LYLSAHTIAKEIGSLVIQTESAQGLANQYTENGKHKLAFTFYKEYIWLKDSMVNEQNTKKAYHAQMQYDFDKKTATDSIQNAEAKKIEEIKFKQAIEQQKIYTYGGAAGFLIMVIVAGISFIAFRNKRKANLEIEKQKLIVEEKQKAVMDSIHYAKRIQTALITSERYIDRQLRRLGGK